MIPPWPLSGVVRYWLAKQEPDGPRGYPLSRLLEEKQTVWDGVHNNLALKHMRQMRPGDMVIYYHTGSERRAVGTMEVISEPYPNPQETNERFVVVDVKYQSTFQKPVTLEQMKSRADFEGWEMLRIGRLSVVPVPPRIWDAILLMSKP